MAFSSVAETCLTLGGSFGCSIVNPAPSGRLMKSMERPSARCALDGSSRMVIPPQSTSRSPSACDPKEIALEGISDLNPQGISAGVDGGFPEGLPRRITESNDRDPHRSGSQPYAGSVVRRTSSTGPPTAKW